MESRDMPSVDDVARGVQLPLLTSLSHSPYARCFWHLWLLLACCKETQRLRLLNVFVASTQSAPRAQKTGRIWMDYCFPTNHYLDLYTLTTIIHSIEHHLDYCRDRLGYYQLKCFTNSNGASSEIVCVEESTYKPWLAGCLWDQQTQCRCAWSMQPMSC